MGWLQCRVMHCLRVRALPEPPTTCHPGGFLRRSRNNQSCTKRRAQLLHLLLLPPMIRSRPCTVSRSRFALCPPLQALPESITTSPSGSLLQQPARMQHHTRLAPHSCCIPLLLPPQTRHRPCKHLAWQPLPQDILGRGSKKLPWTGRRNVPSADLPTSSVLKLLVCCHVVQGDSRAAMAPFLAYRRAMCMRVFVRDSAAACTGLQAGQEDHAHQTIPRRLAACFTLPL